MNTFLASMIAGGGLMAALAISPAAHAQENQSRDAKLMRVSHMINDAVEDSQGDRVGTLENFAIDTDSGHIVYAIVSTRGARGMADRTFAIPMAAVSFEGTREVLNLHFDRDRLENAPEFNARSWSSLNSREFSRRIHEHFNFDEPKRQTRTPRDRGLSERGDTAQYTNFNLDDTETISGRVASIDRDDAEDHRAGVVTVALQTNSGDRVIHLAPDWFLQEKEMQIRLNDRLDVTFAPARLRGERVFVATEINKAGQRLTLRNRADGRAVWASGRHKDKDQDQTVRASTNNFVRATELLGFEVADRSNDAVGEIEDLVFDLKNQRILFALIDPESDVVSGDEYLVAPWQAFTYSGSDQLVIRSDNQWRNAPTISLDQYTRLSEAQFAQRIYAFYGVDGDIVYGYTEPNTDRMRGWNYTSTYNRQFDERKIVTVSGSVIEIERFTPASDMATGVMLRLRTPNDQSLPVHLGPEWFISNQAADFRRGDEVTVTGSRIEFDGRTIIMPIEVTRQNRVFVLRYRNGIPVWDAWMSASEAEDLRRYTGDNSSRTQDDDRDDERD